MRRIGLGLVLLTGCVRHVPPEDTRLPPGLDWCANAKRTLWGARVVWLSSVRLTPDLRAQPYTITLLLD